MKNPMFSLAIFIPAFSLAGQANALTLEEFDSLPTESQVLVLNQAFDGIYSYYKSNGMSERADCLVGMYERVSAPESLSLVDSVVLSLKHAREDSSKTYKVEDIIFGVIERECSPPK